MENLERYEPSNEYNYTEKEIAMKDYDIKDLKQKFPTVPEAWIAWAWDICKNCSQEEIDQIFSKASEKSTREIPNEDQFTMEII